MDVVLPNSFPLAIFLRCLYDSCILELDLNRRTHYCSMQYPCVDAAHVLQPLRTFRLVSSSWNRAFTLFRETGACTFFARVEDVYYPNAQHVNARVRAAVLMGRYRVVRTIEAEYDRGVFEAVDFRAPGGCVAGEKVVVKAWTDAEDSECATERLVYARLKAHAVDGVPAARGERYDAACGVYALVLERLGPSLQQMLDLTPSGTMSECMVVSLAIHLGNRYEALHQAGVIHNGVKPGNVCLASPSQNPGKISIIDFGLSHIISSEANRSNSHSGINAVRGNRQFLSVLGHFGLPHSQRDDLESLGYLFSFLFHGHLPWHPFPPELQKNRKHQTLDAPIWPTKIAAPATVLFRDMDTAFLDFWRDVKSLACAEVPDYAQLRARFVAAWKAHASWGEGPGDLDWIEVYRRLEKDEEDRVRARRENFRRLLGGQLDSV